MKVDPTTYPISWFRDRNIEKALVLRPPYQRKPVWTNKLKAYLIDTILNNYHIPEIYMHRVTDPSGKSIYNVVDGQQRIRSILDFIAGEFSLLDEYTPQYADNKFQDLPEGVQLSFWSYTLYVREITNASADEVGNLFKRMNRYVVPLNPQELRHATYSGDFIKLMEDISEDEFWTENKIVRANEIRRMNDVQFVSDLFISMMHGIQDKTKEMDKYYAYFEENGFPEKARWHRSFQNILDAIVAIFPDLRDARWRNKSDFYTLFMVLNEVLKESYIPKSNYKRIKRDLDKFSAQISEATIKTSKPQRFSKEVLTYSNAVMKSTTDKDRRITRHKIVLSIVSKYARKT